MVFIAKFNVSGNQVKGIKFIKGNQPPRKSIAVTDEIKIILLYSARKNKTKPAAEYSTLYPETSSASASGRSNGCLFVSAKAQIKNKINTGSKGIAYQTSFCPSTKSVKLRLLPTTRSERITAPKEIS